LRRRHFVRVKQGERSGMKILNRLARRFGWRTGVRSSRRGGEEGGPAPVEPDRPKPVLEGGAAAPLDEDEG
jgi:hypothetical protein